MPRSIPASLGPVPHPAGKPKPRPTESATTRRAAASNATPSPPAFTFRLTPEAVAAHLSRFVIGQDEAKKVLSVALCDHFQHVRLAREGDTAPFYQKQNVLILGPTGVGKTHLIRSAAELIGVPFLKADATKFSETGYAGADVDDLVRDLVLRSGGDVEAASRGIIYLDEVDKLASAGEHSSRDVSGRGVQTNLLKLMEDGDVPLISPGDVTGQMQAALEMARGHRSGRPDSVSTRDILFIASGAFSGLEKMVAGRARGDESPLATARTSDLIRFGLEPEFVGRLPVRVACRSLTKRDLFEILHSSESSLLNQYKRSFRAYGIRLEFRVEAIRRIAELAHTEETGARGLMTVLERVFREIKFRLPSTGVKKLVLTRRFVDQPEGELSRLMSGAKAV